MQLHPSTPVVFGRTTACMQLLTARETAAILRVSIRTLRDRRFRRRLGLKPAYVNGRLRFFSEDIERVVERQDD